MLIAAAVQNDYSLGEPDWGEVTADTALDLQELLPTKKELLQLIERFGGTEEDAKVADELWHSAQKEEAAKQQAGQHGDLQRSSLHRALDVDVMAMHRDEDSGPGEGSGKRGDAGKRMAQQLKEQDDSALAGMAAKKERKQESHQARRNEVYKSVHSADALLKMFQVRGGTAFATSAEVLLKARGGALLAAYLRLVVCAIRKAAARALSCSVLCDNGFGCRSGVAARSRANAFCRTCARATCTAWRRSSQRASRRAFSMASSTPRRTVSSPLASTTPRTRSATLRRCRSSYARPYGCVPSSRP